MASKKSPCLELVQRSVPDMTGKELEEIIELMKANQQEKVKAGMTPSEAAKKASEEVAAAFKAAAKYERRAAAINRRIRLQGVDHVMNEWADDPVEGILAMIYGSPKARPGSRNSAAAAQSANFRRYIGGMQKELDEEGVFDVFRRGEMDLDVAKALWSIEDERILATLPSSAVKVAKILNKYRELARLEANRAGAWIGKAKNYIVRQTHSPDRILRAGFEEWKKTVMIEADISRMFPEGVPPDLNDWLREAFANLTTGVRPRSSLEARAERMSSFKGPRNLAKRLSQERVFYFKDAEAWHRYNQKFGHDSLRVAYVNDIHRRAEATGMIQVLGTNPEYNIDSIIKAVRTQLSRLDPERLRKFDSKSRGGAKFEEALREVSGYTRTIGSSNLAMVGSFARFWNIITSLGGAVIPALTDVPVKAATLRYQGASFFGNLAKGLIAPFNRLINGTGSAEKRAILHAIGYFNDIALRNMVSRFSPDETIPGKIQAATNVYFKLNLLGPYTDEGRRSGLEAMGNYLGTQSDLPWSQLSERTRNSLERYSINEGNWDLVRRGVVTDDEGNKFLTPEAIRQLPLDAFLELARPIIEQVNRGLVGRIQKRMKADVREHEWVEKRHAAFTEKLEAANKRLIELAERAEGRVLKRKELLDGRIDEEVRKAEQSAETKRQTAFDEFVDTALELNKELGEIGSKLEDLRDWWKLRFDFELAPLYGKRLIRKVGLEEGTLRQREAQAEREYNRARAELRKQLEQANKSIDGLREKLKARADEEIESREKDTAASIVDHYETFNEVWAERHEDLKTFIKEMDDRAAQREVETDEDLKQHGSRIQRVMDDSRNEVANRLQRYYADEIDSAIITPDARAQAFVRRGTQAGTPMGEALRLFTQFKTYAIGIVQRGLMREFYGYGKGKGGRLGMSEVQGLATLIASSMVFGYVAMTIKDLIAGKNPRPLDNWKTYRDAMAQGGSFGIYGDYLLGSQARFGGGFLSTLAGPTFGKLDDVMEVWGSVQDANDPRAKMLKIALKNVPGNNLFYMKTAIDHMILYELQEAMNPGYLRRFERKIAEETGAEWWLAPSEVTR